jgi:hypothetical protein
MTKSELELLLRQAGAIAHDKHFFLFGSQSLRAICPRYPKDFPKTLEADLYPRHNPEAWALLRSKMGRNSLFFKKHGFFLDCVDPALSTLPDGWTERLIPFRTPRTGGVTAWCLEPHDLFASKLSAWREKDQQFLKAMLKHKLIKPAIAMNRIEDLPISDGRKKELNVQFSQLVEGLKAKKTPKR